MRIETHILSTVGCLIIVVVNLTSSPAFAKCIPRVCFRAKIEILTCKENPTRTKFLRDTYSRLVEKGHKLEDHLGDKHFDLTGRIISALPCDERFGSYSRIKEGEIESYVGKTESFAVANGEEEFCKKSTGLHPARIRTDCCDGGRRTEAECEKNLLLNILD